MRSVANAAPHRRTWFDSRKQRMKEQLTKYCFYSIVIFFLFPLFLFSALLFLLNKITGFTWIITKVTGEKQ